LTHTYAGYAMVREARAMCASGRLGKIRKVAVEYLQGWMSKPIEKTGHKQAAWRADPAQNGPGGSSATSAHMPFICSNTSLAPGDWPQRHAAFRG
jgi:predicted dehydrogenase